VTAGAIAGPIVQMDVREQIVTAHRQFLEKRDVGKIVLLPGQRPPNSPFRSPPASDGASIGRR
jgi:hypothetical protein